MAMTELQHTVPAMRILENEHHYLTSLMDEWHAIVLNITNDRYPLEEARREFTRLCRLLADFKRPLRQHTEKEEKHFFPLLGEYIGYDQGPIVSIEHEHKEIEAYIDHALHHAGLGAGGVDGSRVDGLGADAELTMAQMKRVAQDAGEAFETLTIHFVKEEAVLFPMVARVMKRADRDKLFDQLHTLIG